jgi:8-amino-3,8-dideoxy-alpha-D-manno-octulosonate transaminase
MPGYELFGAEERQALNEIFEKQGGVVFAHGFDAMRNGHFKVREFERAMANRFNMPHAQAVSSGSAALKVALQALGVGPGDEVITQSFTFVATVEAIKETGATPVIVDVNDTLNMDPAAFEAAITSKTKVVIPVHMLGECAELDEIGAIADRHKIVLMEDAAQAVGASYKGRMAGSIGLINACSTDAGKTICTGEGGVIFTHDQNLWERARGFHDHGHEYSKTKGRGEEGAISGGFNYRMTEMQAAVGLAQLAKLDLIVSSQRANKAKLMERLKNMQLPFRRSVDAAGDLGDSIIFFLPNKERTTAFVAAMRAKGIGTKNLPDAINWHYAKHWGHLLDGYPRYQGKLAGSFGPSSSILECAVAIGVNVKMDPSRIDFIGDSLVEIAGQTV